MTQDTIKAILISAIAALAPIHSVLIVTGILIFADFITGMWAAIKRGESINSAAMRRTVSKLFIYHTVLITGFITETVMLGSLVPISKLCAGVIGMVEIKSIFENANTILGYDLLSMVLEKLGSKNDLK